MSVLEFHDDRARPRPAKRAVVSKPDFARGRVVRHYRDDDIGALRRLARGRSDARALVLQRLCLGAGPVPDRQIEALGEPVGGHAGPHRAKAEKRDASHEVLLEA